MDLQNSFVVPADIDTAWRTLLDVEAIAPCMPGATLETVDGDVFTGSVKVKLGPVNMTYGGKARFVEKDEAQHRAVVVPDLGVVGAAVPLEGHPRPHLVDALGAQGVGGDERHETAHGMMPS